MINGPANHRVRKCTCVEANKDCEFHGLGNLANEQTAREKCTKLDGCTKCRVEWARGTEYKTESNDNSAECIKKDCNKPKECCYIIDGRTENCKCAD